MPLTPADVHNVAFSKPPIGKRGYNEDEVDAFLDLVEAELTRLIEENTDLQQRVSELGTELAAEKLKEPTPPAPSSNRHEDSTSHTTSLESDNLRVARVLTLAQDTADRLTDSAREESAKIIAEARSKNDQIMAEARVSAESTVNEAHQRAEDLLDDAKRRSDSKILQAQETADSIISDAQTRSDNQIRQAQETADALLADSRVRSEKQIRQAEEKIAILQSDAERKRSEVLGAIAQQQGLLEQLRTFEREYRVRLKTYLTSQLEELDQRGSAAPADVPLAPETTRYSHTHRVDD